MLETVPVPVTTPGVAKTLKLVLPLVSPDALAVTVYVPASSVLGPPMPAAAPVCAAVQAVNKDAATPVSGKLTVACPLPLLSVATVAVSQNGPPASLLTPVMGVGGATSTVTEYDELGLPFAI